MQRDPCSQQKGPTVKYICLRANPPKGKSAKGEIHRQRENPPTVGREDPLGVVPPSPVARRSLDLGSLHLGGCASSRLDHGLKFSKNQKSSKSPKMESREAALAAD